MNLVEARNFIEREIKKQNAYGDLLEVLEEIENFERDKDKTLKEIHNLHEEQVKEIKVFAEFKCACREEEEKLTSDLKRLRIKTTQSIKQLEIAAQNAITKTKQQVKIWDETFKTAELEHEKEMLQLIEQEKIGRESIEILKQSFIDMRERMEKGLAEVGG